MVKDNKTILGDYLPEASLRQVLSLFERYPCHLKIVNSRRSKHGDFRALPGGRYEITINYNLNPYRFLLTLIHELAHLVTYQKCGRVKPHGNEWKRHFRELMLPFLNPEVFPETLLPFLAHYLRNPKASTDTDLHLSMALRKYDEQPPETMVFELQENTKFIFNNRIYQKGKKRRTRHECIELRSGKKYLFHHHAAVKPIKD